MFDIIYINIIMFIMIWLIFFVYGIIWSANEKLAKVMLVIVTVFVIIFISQSMSSDGVEWDHNKSWSAFLAGFTYKIPFIIGKDLF